MWPTLLLSCEEQSEENAAWSGSPFFLDFFFCSQLPISFRMRAGGRGGMRGEGVCRDGNAGRVPQGGSSSGGRGRDRTTVSLFQKGRVRIFVCI